MSLFDAIKKASILVDKVEQAPRPIGGQIYYNRTKYSILTSATSELGELAEEVMIDQHHTYKTKGDDGIVGEAIDTIACLLDLIHKYDSSITEEELTEIARIKCLKWTDNVKRRRGFID